MNKLFGASILVLGMAVSAAHATDVDVIADNELNFASKSDSLNDAKGDGAANAAGEESVAIEDSFNKLDTDVKTDINVKKTSFDSDLTVKDSFNKDVDVDVTKTSLDTDIKTDIDVKKTSFDSNLSIKDSFNKDTDVDVKKTSLDTDIKTEDSLNNAWGDGSANAASDSEAHLKSDNKYLDSHDLSTKDSFNKDLDVKTDISTKTEISNKDSYNTAKLDLESNKDSHDVTAKGSYNTDNSTKDSHDLTTKDSFNKSSKDSHDISNKDSYNSETTNKDSFNDNGTHITVGDVHLKLENNAAIANAELKNVSIGNKVDVNTKFGGGIESEAKAELGEGAVSGWAGLNQMNVTAGNNNSSQMSQQVTANIRTLDVH